MATFTTKEIAGLIRAARKDGADKYLTDAEKARGVGRLRVRARPNGQAVFYFRYSDASGKQDSIALGQYAEAGKGGLSLKEAGDKAAELSKLYQSGTRDLRAYLDHTEAEARAQREMAARERAEAERQASAGTLRALLDGYIAHLERQGKVSAQDTRNIIRRNVLDEFPHLADSRAADISHRDISAVLAKLIDRGAGRTAGKLRAYLRAAFSAALQAEGDPTIHPDLHGFNLTANPAAIVPAKSLAKFNRARDRNLNVSELRAFLKALDKEPEGAARDAVLLSLLLGGQRFAQLVRVRPADVDMDAGEITLFDGKGARKQPRRHCLPLTERAAKIVERRLAMGSDDKPLAFLFTTHGKVPIRTETVSDVVTTISAGMMANKTAREPFEARDLRRTCETMFAGMGISRDVRAQVLSHGLAGVQTAHYDRHSYADEKRAALEAWDKRLLEIESGKPAGNVVSLARAKQKHASSPEA